MPRLPRLLSAVLVAFAAVLVTPGLVNSSDQRWRDPTLPPDVRARAVLQAMTQDEKLALVHTQYGLGYEGRRPKPAGAIGSAAYGPGVPRLGIPPQQESDAGLGIANPGGIPALNAVTALPCGLAIGATFDPALARAAGAVIGGEARANGFDVLLAGGANLARDPRGGRNFEYVSEDPLLTGRMAGAMVAGIQGKGVISTLKHFALNDQETGRVVVSSVIGDREARESDLLAFELALEAGHPGAVMTGYNRVNGIYASENVGLIDDVLKRDWRYPGWVMSDWGAVHSTVAAARAGLDQESGEDFDAQPFFARPLKVALERGEIEQARLDDMALRVLRSNFAAGVVDDPPRPGGQVDAADDASVARTIAANAIVLLQNRDGMLPLRRDLRRVVMIGAHADRGVLSGGGSSQVTPKGAFSMIKEQPYHVTMGLKFYDPSSPVAALRRRMPGTRIDFVAGSDHAAAAAAARGADAVVVFAEQWVGESHDAPSLALPSEQDQLIEAVATANPHSVVVLETGDPVLMPWLGDVGGVIEAWYSGARGGDAIADVLLGAVNPSGRLPMTFPRDEAGLPRPRLPDPATTEANPGGPGKGAYDANYTIEGADIGYKWAIRRAQAPLFPFGFGLTYTTFAYDGLRVTVDGTRVVVSLEVRNTGARAGTDTPQLYVDGPQVDERQVDGRQVDGSPAGFGRRLAGWARVTLAPGEAKRVSIAVDPRLLARFDETTHDWRIAPGRYALAIRRDALAAGPTTDVTLTAAHLPP